MTDVSAKTRKVRAKINVKNGKVEVKPKNARDFVKKQPVKNISGKDNSDLLATFKKRYGLGQNQNQNQNLTMESTRGGR